ADAELRPRKERAELVEDRRPVGLQIVAVVLVVADPHVIERVAPRGARAARAEVGGGPVEHRVIGALPAVLGRRAATRVGAVLVERERELEGPLVAAEREARAQRGEGA